LTAATFAWQTLNERRRAAVLAKQIEREKSLADQKHNFITLSSHYFRTPLTLVSNGIELLASLGAEASLSGELKQIGQKLKANVDLMLQAIEQMPSLSAEAKVSAGLALGHLCSSSYGRLYSNKSGPL
jgi:signal transduction histidine kinase